MLCIYFCLIYAMKWCNVTWNGLMQNALHFSFFLFPCFPLFLFLYIYLIFLWVFFFNFLLNLYWGSFNLLPFSLPFIAKQMAFLHKQNFFSKGDQHYFLFFSLSSKHWSLFRYKTFYFMSDQHSFLFLSLSSKQWHLFRHKTFYFMSDCSPWSFNGSIWLIYLFQEFFSSFQNHPTLLGFMMHLFLRTLIPFVFKIPTSNKKSFILSIYFNHAN